MAQHTPPSGRPSSGRPRAPHGDPSGGVPAAGRPKGAAPAVLLVYGNQSYPVDLTAQAFANEVLGDGPRDFSFQRFDAAELLKGGGGETVLGRVEAFEEACLSVPLLSERYVVRLDHVEAVRLPDRSAQAMLRSLEELRVTRVPPRAGATEAAASAGAGRADAVGPAAAGAEETWAPVDTEGGAVPPAGAVPLSRWVAGVTPRAAGGPLVELAPGADGVGILSPDGATRLGLRAFLRQRVKTKWAFADESAAEAAAAEGEAPAASHASSGAARLHQILERVLDGPPPGMALVLTAECTRDTDLSKELLERIRRAGRIDKHVTYPDQAPVDWLLGQARARKLPLSPPGAEELIARVGNDMGRLVQELERLALLAGPGETLSEQTLLDAVHVEPQGSVFTLAERVAARDLAGALAVLERFLADSPNEHPLLIGVLARHFRQLRQALLAQAEGVPEAELAQRLKLHPFLAKRVAAQAGRFSVPELERIQRALAELDVAARRRGAVMRLLVQDFLQRICQGAFKPRSGRGQG